MAATRLALSMDESHNSEKIFQKTFEKPLDNRHHLWYNEFRK